MFFQAPDGTMQLWRVGPDGAFSNSVTLGTASAWKLKGAGYLNNPSRAALYWQQPGGLVAAWCPGLANDPNGLPSMLAQLIGAANAWSLCAAGDLDGDGIADLLLQTPAGDAGVWFMKNDGTLRTARGWGNVGPWRLCGAARKR